MPQVADKNKYVLRSHGTKYTQIVTWINVKILNIKKFIVVFKTSYWPYIKHCGWSVVDLVLCVVYCLYGEILWLHSFTIFSSSST
jgi:hypothetical protein